MSRHVGKSNGQLVVIADLGIQSFGSYSTRVVRCQCLCGTEIEIKLSNLRKQQSCASCASVRISASRTTHGLSHTRLWNIHRGMLQRCTNPKNKSYRYYGANGITVDPRWSGEGGFQRFIEDMGEPPTSGHSLGRVKNHLGYSKGNCEWQTRQEQQRNTSANRLLTVDGVTKPLVAWAETTGINERTLRGRAALGITGVRLIDQADLRLETNPLRNRDASGRFSK